MRCAIEKTVQNGIRNLISEDGTNYKFVKFKDGVKAYDGKSIDKLYAIENIEQELGIPLEILFKALKDGIYYDYEHREPGDVSFRFCYKELIVRYTCHGETDYDYLELRDYGETWALTKKELEAEKNDRKN